MGWQNHSPKQSHLLIPTRADGKGWVGVQIEEPILLGIQIREWIQLGLFPSEHLKIYDTNPAFEIVEGLWLSRC